MAASVNSSCAPNGPRSRSRPSLKMRLRWANSISTRLRWRRDCSKSAVLANARATSRAPSWRSRGYISHRRAGATAHLEGTGIAIGFGGAVAKCIAVVHGSRRMQQLVVRTDIDVAILIEDEVGT